MRKNNSKLGIGRICLIFYILLCSMFTSDNAFSHRRWKKNCAVVTYNKRFDYITIDFLFYDYCLAYDAIAYLKWCEFYYSEDGLTYNHLMSAATKSKKSTDRASIFMYNKKTSENIQFLIGYKPTNILNWVEGTFSEIEVNTTYRNFRVGPGELISNIASMTVKWDLSQSSRHIKLIKITGLWITNKYLGSDIKEIYKPVIVKSNLNSLKNDSSVLKSEMSNKVKVTKNANAISVTGAVPGENIQVCTITGAEVKSVVATDDVVNIKLPKNQLYIVKTGQARYKVAL